MGFGRRMDGKHLLILGKARVLGHIAVDEFGSVKTVFIISNSLHFWIGYRLVYKCRIKCSYFPINHLVIYITQWARRATSHYLNFINGNIDGLVGLVINKR